MERAARVAHGEVFARGRLAHEFWGGRQPRPTKTAAAATRRVRDTFHELYEKRYADIPWTRETEGWGRTPSSSAPTACRSRNGSRRSTRLPTSARFCEYYCWSSFGGGGLGGLELRRPELPDGRVRRDPRAPGRERRDCHVPGRRGRAAGVTVVTNRTAGAVRPAPNGVEVAAFRGDDVHLYPARACVVAVPRFVAARIVADFPKRGARSSPA